MPDRRLVVGDRILECDGSLECPNGDGSQCSVSANVQADTDDVVLPLVDDVGSVAK